MRKIILLLSILILQLFVVSAYTYGDNGIDVFVKNNTIIIQSYTVTPSGLKAPMPTTPWAIIPINNSLGATFNCVPYNSIINETHNEIILTNCTYNVNYEKEIPLINICSNATINQTLFLVDQTILTNFSECIKYSSQLEVNIRECAGKSQQSNITNTDYVKCNADLAVCNTKQTTIDDLNKQIESMTNQKYIWGVVGLVAGIVGYMFYTGKIGGQKAKQAGENYQRGQSA